MANPHRSAAERLAVDSNVWIGLFNRADALHSRATAALERYGLAAQLLTTNLILYEVVTVLAIRGSRARAIEAGEFLYRSATRGSLQIVHVDEVLERSAWQLFRTVRTKDVSFADCALATVASVFKHVPILTFDRHFQSLGKRLDLTILS